MVALLAAALFVSPGPLRAAGIAVNGAVVDAQSGLPLAGVKLQTIGPTVQTATTNVAGKFTLTDLAPGTYSLQANLSGYETTISEEFSVTPGFLLPLTLALQRASGSTSLRVLARTTVTAARSLQKASVIYESVSANTLTREGVTRTADAVRRLAAIDNSSSDTPVYGDDVHLDIRGIGSLETVSLLDGHPIALGLSSGLNWDISPSFGLRAVNVVYGAGGGDLYGVDAIGGVADMQTLEPSTTPSYSFTQSWGTFSTLSSVFQATGQAGNRWGYAIALGSSGSDGPIKHSILYEPGAAFDITATDPAVIAANTYTVDSSVSNRGMLAKLIYGLGTNTQITATGMGAYFYDDKTGNGDGDFLPMDTALALGNTKLNNFSNPNNVGTPSAINPPNCPAGTFIATNAQGAANGYGLDGITPDGGVTCQTPQQWASFNSGFQGAGPAWQGFTLHDYQLRLITHSGRNTVNINGYSDLYAHTYDRTFQLPYILQANSCDPAIAAANGQSCAGPSPPLNNCPCTLVSNPFWYNEQVNNAGVVGTDSIVWDQNELSVGGYYNNTASLFSNVGSFQPSPIAHETSAFFRDTWHPTNSPLSTTVSAYFKHSSLTNTSFVDPRIALVATPGNDDVYRVAVGQISTQPALSDAAGPFAVGSTGALNGNIHCNALNGAGSGGNPNLHPERATDQEFSWGHRFSRDSTIQLSLYSEDIFNQLFTQDIPALSFSPSYFGSPGGYLAPGSPLIPFASAVASFCGITQQQAVALLSVSGVINIGRSHAEGIDIQGRQHIGDRFFIDYDYATNSSVPTFVPANILANNFLLIPGSQLPFIPLHKYNFAFDYTFGHGLEVRTETWFVSENNPKDIGKYNYSNLVLSAPTGKFGTASVVVNNLFQQYAYYEGRIGEGYPHALNPQFAAPEDYTPLTGNQASEGFGLPFRTVTVIYSLKVQ